MKFLQLNRVQRQTSFRPFRIYSPFTIKSEMSEAFTGELQQLTHKFKRDVGQIYTPEEEALESGGKTWQGNYQGT